MGWVEEVGGMGWGGGSSQQGVPDGVGVVEVVEGQEGALSRGNGVGWDGVEGLGGWGAPGRGDGVGVLRGTPRRGLSQAPGAALMPVLEAPGPI